ncbi:MAG: Rieske (2Fe-2S) protein [Erythrobacter sp.]|uniref:Rieske (2Fe-2S) protein n=1 Tax=Erythrobacter sp. HL-111 TaxID=1798193 RepID=UPI0006DAE3EE|nr:Rieske 2Fe-2S domain-containing protein [Erythrobacter sp. HL-111]KPP95002.1 MAG: dioxygenase 4Fe-4S ferredoxin subunit BphF [Erythrobacteraceae bacterium HL-111]SDS12438.1 3-phenylpropionate/trans-cinnamate dioxygenase ferredoxin subunit [Erythrobacter sp. HL-111]
MGDGERGWQCAGRVDAIPAARPLAVGLGGREVLLCRSGTMVFAVDARCPHAGQSLANGRVRGGTIACPFHGARFRLADGAPTAGPTRRALGTYEVRITGGEVWVRP